MKLSSIQLPVERALKEFFTSYFSPVTHPILCAHDVEILPQEGNYIAIIAGPGDWEEYISNAKSRIEFRVATQVAEAGNRAQRTAEHQAVAGAINNLLSEQNFDDALSTLNAQLTAAGGITIGFSGWEQQGPPLDTHTDVQIISTLPYEFDVFIAEAES